MDDYKSITQQAYNKVADDYAKRDAEVIEETFEVKAALDRFISLLPSGASVLDIGSGGGRDSLYMFNKGLAVTGIDLSERMIQNAKEKASEVTYLQMDFENLEFEDASFDGVWANASLHHVPKDKLPSVLENIYKILKPNSFFFSINKHGSSDGILETNKYGKMVKRHFSFYQPDELAEMIRKVGFSIEDSSLSTSDEWLNILARK